MYQKYKMLIPFLVLVFLCGQTAIFSILNGFELNSKNYTAFVGVGISIVSFFAFRKYYGYLLGATLFIGLINLAFFTVNRTWFTLSVFGLPITIQWQSLLLCILTAIIALPLKKEVKVLNVQQFSENTPQKRSEEVERFKNKFAHKSIIELSEIINGKGYTAAAVEAARQLLKEKKQDGSIALE